MVSKGIGQKNFIADINIKEILGIFSKYLMSVADYKYMSSYLKTNMNKKKYMHTSYNSIQNIIYICVCVCLGYTYSITYIK